LHCEYIPRPLTYYQWKAQSISDAECRAETLRTDKVNDIRLKEKSLTLILYILASLQLPSHNWFA
jgi:hypothetical protein